MKKNACVFLLAWVFLCILACPATNAHAAMEWKVAQQLRLAEKPRAVAASFNGEYLYILVEGKLIVYSLVENKAKYTFAVDQSIDMMTLTNADNFLVLTSSSEKIVRIIQLELISQIDTSGLPYRGPGNAPVTIVVFIDYECSHCAGLLPLLEQLLKKYGDRLKLVFKNFPSGPDQIGFKAATAAMAANEQNRFWEYHTRLFANGGALDESKVQALALELGLDMEKFAGDMQRSDMQDLVNRDVKEGLALGVTGTPTVFVNGKRVQDLNSDDVQKLIESEIETHMNEETK